MNFRNVCSKDINKWDREKEEQKTYYHYFQITLGWHHGRLHPIMYIWKMTHPNITMEKFSTTPENIRTV